MAKQCHLAAAGAHLECSVTGDGVHSLSSRDECPHDVDESASQSDQRVDSRPFLAPFALVATPGTVHRAGSCSAQPSRTVSEATVVALATRSTRLSISAWPLRMRRDHSSAPLSSTAGGQQSHCAIAGCLCAGQSGARRRGSGRRTIRNDRRADRSAESSTPPCRDRRRDRKYGPVVVTDESRCKAF